MNTKRYTLILPTEAAARLEALVAPYAGTVARLSSQVMESISRLDAEKIPGELSRLRELSKKKGETPPI